MVVHENCQAGPEKAPRRSQINCTSTGEKYFPTKFHNFWTVYAKEQKHYDSEIYNQYFIKTVREIPGRPHECPKTVVQSSGEKYFSTKFHHFCVKYFSSFRNFPSVVLDTVMSPRAHTLQNVYYIPNLNKKKNIAKINLPLQENHKNKIEKLRLTPKLNARGKPSTRFPPEKDS